MAILLKLSVLLTLLTLTYPILDQKSKAISLRKPNKNQHIHNLRTNNDKYIKRLSTKILTDHETALFAKDLKFIPTPPKRYPASHKNPSKDIEAFTRYMRLQYIFANSKSKPHPRRCWTRSTWPICPITSLQMADWFFHLCASSVFDFLWFSPFIKWFTIIFCGKVWVDRCSKPQFL